MQFIIFFKLSHEEAADVDKSMFERGNFNGENILRVPESVLRQTNVFCGDKCIRVYTDYLASNLIFVFAENTAVQDRNGTCASLSRDFGYRKSLSAKIFSNNQ